MKSRFPLVVGASLVAMFAAPRLCAQIIPAFVDPTTGNDATGATGANAGNNPFRTIQAAIDALAPQVSQTQPGRVVVHPGVIHGQANGETFPIRLANYVSLKGDSVAIIGTQDDLRPGTFEPVGIAGARADREVLLDLSNLTASDSNAIVEGFTFRGGNVQIYWEREPDQETPGITIANNVFDMLDQPFDTNTSYANVLGPEFGVLSVAQPTLVEPFEYWPGEIRFLNNTVIMAWLIGPTALAAAVCQNGAVGFCDVNVPPPVAEPLLQGVGDHLLTNNIFRTFFPFSGRARALLGVDAGDTALVPNVGQFNAFDPALIGDTTGPGPGLPQYTSLVQGPLPAPSINVNPQTGGRDFACVGEYVCWELGLVGGGGPHDFSRRDWRLLPASVYINAGVNPYSLMGGGTGFEASNGAIYQRETDLRDAYDYDFEGYGNPRIAAAPKNPTGPGIVDLGADEASNLIFARSHQNDSVCHSDFATRGLITGPAPYPVGVGPGAGAGVGSGMREVISPDPGTYSLAVNAVPALGPLIETPIPTEWLRSSVGAPIPVGGGIGYDSIYVVLPPGIGMLSLSTVANAAYSAPLDFVPLSFGRVAVPDGLTSNPSVYWNSMQGVFTPTGGAATLTNAHEEFYAK